MPYRICKTFEVESGHMLAKHPEKCRFPHGHTRKVELVLEATALDENEMVCDFKVVKEFVGDLLESYDHSLCMNTADPKYADLKATYGARIIGFENQDPTTELMAATIFLHCAAQLVTYVKSGGMKYRVRPEVRLRSVRVWETSSSWAEYFE